MSGFPYTNGPKDLIVGMLNGFLSGLLGVGGAVCIESRTLLEREAVMLNRAMGTVAVLAAWMFRSKAVPLDLLSLHLDVVLVLLAGSLSGAWYAAEKAKENSWRFLDRFILVILPTFAFVSLAQTMIGDRETARLFASSAAGAFAGVLVGFCTGFATAAIGIAGTLLVVPAIIVLFGIDSKIAGSLALMITLPTILMGFRQFSGVALPVLMRRERRVCLRIACTSLLGAASGVLLLTVVTSKLIQVLILVVIFYTAFMQLSTFFTKYLRLKS